jgi:hypothetical protein
MKNWEYYVEIVEIQPGIRDRLNEIGSCGWEMVSLLPALSEQGIPTTPPSLYAFFKKRKE